MKTILFLVGTRPEFIKIYSVLKKLKEERKFKIILVSSNQQNRILNKYINDFKIDHDLKINNYNSDSDFLSKLFTGLNKYLKKKKLHYILVQGDTSTAYGGALFAFLNQIPVIHLEAGLRTHDLKSPWPEEFYRQNISSMASIHLSQTATSKKNLVAENIKRNIHIVGNPGIDYFFEKISLKKENYNLKKKNKEIIITMHRRESINSNLQKFIDNLIIFSNKKKNYKFIWPVHSNENVQKIINGNKKRFNNKNISFLKPLKYEEFLKHLINADFVITDSGGIQEEAAFIGKPLLIARDKTERTEIVELGLGKIIYADGRGIEKGFNFFLNKKINLKKTKEWQKIQGNGKSSKKVSKILTNYYS